MLKTHTFCEAMCESTPTKRLAFATMAGYNVQEKSCRISPGNFYGGILMEQLHPRSFNSSPLKNGRWKTILGKVAVQGVSLAVNLWGTWRMGSQDLASDMGSFRGPRPQGYPQITSLFRYFVGCGMVYRNHFLRHGIYPLVKLTWLAGKWTFLKMHSLLKMGMFHPAFCEFTGG